MKKHFKLHKNTKIEISTKNQLLHLSAVNFVQGQKDIILCYTIRELKLIPRELHHINYK